MSAIQCIGLVFGDNYKDIVPMGCMTLIIYIDRFILQMVYNLFYIFIFIFLIAANTHICQRKVLVGPFIQISTYLQGL